MELRARLSMGAIVRGAEQSVQKLRLVAGEFYDNRY